MLDGKNQKSVQCKEDKELVGEGVVLGGQRNLGEEVVLERMKGDEGGQPHEYLGKNIPSTGKS